jgi:hypothetical protein
VLRHVDLADRQFEQEQVREQARERPQVHIPDYARMEPGEAPTRIIEARPHVRGGAVDIDLSGESILPKRL